MVKTIDSFACDESRGDLTGLTPLCPLKNHIDHSTKATETVTFVE
jgi:hypothetical protein